MQDQDGTLNMTPKPLNSSIRADTFQLPRTDELFLSAAARGRVSGQQGTSWRVCAMFVIGTTLLPNLPVFWHRTLALEAVEGPSRAVAVIFLELLLLLGAGVLLLALLAMLGRLATRLVGGALLLGSSGAFGWMWREQAAIDVDTVLSLLSPDPLAEAAAFDPRLLIVIGVAGLLPALAWWRQVPPSWWRGRGRTRRFAGWLLCALVALGWMDFARTALAALPPGDPATFASSRAGIAAQAYLPSNWLIALGGVGDQAWRQLRDGALQRPVLRHRHIARTRLDDLVVVVVIGPGGVAHGHDMAKALAPEPDLAAFTGWSCNTSTTRSLACMFVRPQAIVADPSGGPDRITERDVFAVFRELGFRIELFALQGEAAFYNRVGADEIRLRDTLPDDPLRAGRPLDDRLLVGQLRGAIERHEARRTHQPLLVLLQPRASAGADEGGAASIDALLQATRDTVRPRKAWMVYAADRGEGSAAHRASAPPELRRIPMVFWASRSWLDDPANAARHARLLAQAEHARSEPPERHGHHELYATLLGCLGIQSPDGGIDPAHDLCAGP
ncbi:hypothetical protein ACWA7J_06505 [Leptothrix sp. BB-4]